MANLNIEGKGYVEEFIVCCSFYFYAVSTTRPIRHRCYLANAHRPPTPETIIEDLKYRFTIYSTPEKIKEKPV